LPNSVSLLLASADIAPQYESYGEFAKDVIERMTVAHRLACETSNESACMAKRYYDQKVRPKNFEIGDWVLIYSARNRRQCYAKWQRYYQQESVITARVNDVTFIVKPVHSRQQSVLHVDKPGLPAVL
jgi:hypothetical protein